MNHRIINKRNNFQIVHSLILINVKVDVFLAIGTWSSWTAGSNCSNCRARYCQNSDVSTYNESCLNSLCMKTLKCLAENGIWLFEIETASK